MPAKLHCGVIAAVIVLAGMAQSQSADPQPSLGDAAREQQELHPKAENPAAKVYTDDDLAARAKAIDDGDTPSVPESQQLGAGVKKVQSDQASSVSRKRKSPRFRSVYDRRDSSADDVIVIPAGTEIQANMADRVVEAPVRVRFSTPIPALTKVALHIYGYHHQLSYSDNFEVGDYASIASVTIGDVTYPVQTDRVPCSGAGVFTLNAPLRIKR